MEEGKLELDGPVARYWPEFAAAGKESITLRQLLSHRAGLPALREMMPAEALYEWQTMVDALAAEAPWWTPGEGEEAEASATVADTTDANVEEIGRAHV